jgi:hypothetical protein
MSDAADAPADTGALDAVDPFDVNVAPGSLTQAHDYPGRLVFAAPYFHQIPLAEIVGPAVADAVAIVLPPLVQPAADAAAAAKVQELAVQRVGDTMGGPLFLSELIPLQDSEAASKHYVDAMTATGSVPEVPTTPPGQLWVRELGAWMPMPGGTSAGGAVNQIQWNNAGALAGFTMGGDGTLNTATGALTVTKTSGVALGAVATAGYGPAPGMDGTAAAGVATTVSRSDHVHPTDTSRAPLASPALTGTPTVPTAAAGTSTTQTASTAFVQTAATRYLNTANNTGFSVNQRAYVSGAALAAGAFGHDRWKGGAGGGTYTFAQSPGPATTITITAGSLQQVVEGASLVGGNYMLSWTGTAQGRVGAGSYAVSPVSVVGIVAGANTTIEFNTGTVGQVKLEAGTVATAWAPLLARDELANCLRFYQSVGATIRATTAGASQALTGPVYWQAMRAAPTATLAAAGTRGNVSSISVGAGYVSGGTINCNSVAAGDAYVLNDTWNLSADL